MNITYGDQDRVDDRRAHSVLAAAYGGALVTAQWLLAELESVFAAAAGTPKVLRMDTGLSFSTAATVLREQGRTFLHPAEP